MITSNSNAGTDVPQSENADVTTSSQNIANTLVVGSPSRCRAWDEGNKVMHYDFQFIASGDGNNDWIIFTSDKQKLSDTPHPFHNPFFRQQIKITQEVRKDIYLGDIVEGLDTETNRRVRGQVVARDDEYFYGVGNILFDELDLSTIEVKGNVFQNPELLESVQ